MTTENMRVHEALVELKTLEKRISDAVNETTWVLANKHSNTKVGGVDVQEYIDEVKSRYQKALDLIRRRDAIKRAVVASNATTKVTVAGVEYTVAEAIDRKNHGVLQLNRLMVRLTRDLTQAKRQADLENGAGLEARADQYVKSLIGNTDVKGMTAEIKKMRDDFIAAQTTELVDPIGAHKEIERMEEEINTFLAQVDSALSVSNAITVIEVNY